MVGTTALPTHAAALNDDAPASKILASRHPALELRLYYPLEPAAFSYTAGSNSKVEVPPYLVRARVRVRGLG